MIVTARLRLVPWREDHRAPLRAMHANPEVMDDYGGPIDRAASDSKLDRYAAAYAKHGFGRMAVEAQDDAFLGYVGVMPAFPGHPLGEHFEAGWRLSRTAWGQGYASEAARAAIDDALARPGVAEVLAYTGPENSRSQAVMARLGLRRDADRDFTAEYPDTPPWRGLVWVAERL